MKFIPQKPSKKYIKIAFTWEGDGEAKPGEEGLDPGRVAIRKTTRSYNQLDIRHNVKWNSGCVKSTIEKQTLLNLTFDKVNRIR